MSASLTLKLQATDLVLCDFDGTISVIDTGLAVIEQLQLQAAWEAEYEWRRGEISSMECLSRQWDMVKLSPDELSALVDGLAIDQQFSDLLALVRARGAGLAILSDGLDFYIDRMLRRLGLVACERQEGLRGNGCVLRLANRATVSGEGVKITFPHSNDCGQCGNCKTAHLFRLRPGFARTIYVGDGHSDLCVARYADVIFAKHALAEDCLKAGRDFCLFENLADVMALLH